MESKMNPEKPAGEAEAEAPEATSCQECPLKAWTTAFHDLEHGFRDLLPEEFWRHRRAAKREALLAVRSLLDAAIERLEKEPAPKVRKSATKIAVQ